MSEKSFDTIIVGAGPAGCVLALRLTESEDSDVLLIDAGPDFGSDPSGWPAELLDPVGPELDTHSWGYAHRADKNGRRLQLPRGRVFGGCSSVNSCIWLHGSSADYDDWAALGNPGWDFANLAQHFEASQRDPLQSNDRPGDHLIDVWRTPQDQLSVIDNAILETAGELGMTLVDDLNGSHRQEPSAGPTPKNLRGGGRLNGALSYLAAARSRENLALRPNSLVDRVIFNGRRAVGVKTADGDEIFGREVILCAGAYGSPAILMRSGVGPSNHLSEMGIPIVADLPGVGENLMDHPYLAPYTSGRTMFFISDHAIPDRRIFIQTMIKARSRQVQEEIDLHIYPREQRDELGRWVLGFGVSLQYSRSRGRVRLTSTDPDAPLDIDHRYFADPIDLEALTDGIELLDQLVRTRPLANLLEGPARQDESDPSRESIQKVIRAEVGTTFHPSSSCMMGPATDPTSVVDQVGRVRRVERVRVVDASIFPIVPRCNLHAPTVAVAEHMAELIKGSRVVH